MEVVGLGSSLQEREIVTSRISVNWDKKSFGKERESVKHIEYEEKRLMLCSI